MRSSLIVRSSRFAAGLSFVASLSLLSTAVHAQTISERQRGDANRLIDAALADSAGYARLATLTDRFGHRLSGSQPLEDAITWILEGMRRDGLANVRGEPVVVPHWVRGEESATLVSPRSAPLHMLGLGMSVGTPAAGITAPVLVVGSFAELEKRAAEAKGKIVLFDYPFPAGVEALAGYSEAVAYRGGAPAAAAKAGAVATLIRSVASFSIQSPHTGSTRYDPAVARIPAAALSVEDAEMLHRMAVRGEKIVVTLKMRAQTLPDAQSRNVVAELRGSTKPDEVVVLGGHIDSWDVGQGAQDDGSGIMGTLAAVNVIKKMGLHPKRTIRVVFWVNEENGGAGGIAYRKGLTEAQLANHVAAIEMDGGAEAPVGYGFGVNGSPRRLKPGETPSTTAPVLTPGEEHSLVMLRQIASLLTPVGADKIKQGGGGSDIEPLMMDGVPSLGETTTGAHYFDWHHTEADTLDKVDPQDFRKNVASLAVMTYILADMPERLTGHKGASEE